MIPNECIIVGGGKSIKNADLAQLGACLKNKFTVLTNYAYKYFEGSFLVCIDENFYKSTDIKKNPDIYEELRQLPLIIGVDDRIKAEDALSNTLRLRCNPTQYFRENAKEKSFFTGSLTGVFALTIASYLMNYEGNIFLLGFDWTQRDVSPIDIQQHDQNTTVETHFYDIKHRGIGHVSYYENHDPHNYFKSFQEPKLNIYNVSLESNIETFDKIDYTEMYSLLSNEIYDQENLRNEVRSKLL